MSTRPSTDLLSERLLRAARVEQRISHLIDALRSRDTEPPSPEIGTQLELLEQRRAEVIEQIVELQRLLEPRPRGSLASGRVG